MFEKFVRFEDPLGYHGRISVIILKNPVNIRNGTIYHMHDRVGYIVKGDAFPENTYLLDNGTYRRYRIEAIREIRAELKRKGYRSYLTKNNSTVKGGNKNDQDQGRY